MEEEVKKKKEEREPERFISEKHIKRRQNSFLQVIVLI